MDSQRQIHTHARACVCIHTKCILSNFKGSRFVEPKDTLWANMKIYTIDVIWPTMNINAECKIKYSGIQHIPFVFRHLWGLTNSMSEASAGFPLSRFVSFYFSCQEMFCNGHYKVILQLSHPSDFSRKSVQDKKEFIIMTTFCSLVLISEPQLRKTELEMDLISTYSYLLYLDISMFIFTARL